MLTGFAPGILVAVLLYLDKTDPTTHSSKVTTNKVATSKVSANKVHTAPRAQTRRQSGKPRTRTAQVKNDPGAKDGTDKIKFTFYKALSGSESTIGEKQILAETRRFRKKQREARKRARLHKIREQKKRRARKLEKKRKQRAIAARRARNKKLLQQKNRQKLARKKQNIRKRKVLKTAARKKTVKKTLVKSTNRRPAKIRTFPDYILIQAGSFRQKKQAERRKAKLALYGLNSAISSVKIKGETWFRVRVGPFRSYKDMKVKLVRLRKKKINVIPIRVKR